MKTYCWKDSVSVFTTTQALTNRSNVIPIGGPFPIAGPDAIYNAYQKQIQKTEAISREQTQQRTHHISAL